MELSKIKELYVRALGEARRLEKPRLTGGHIIVYGPGAEAPAHLLYLGVLHAGERAELVSAATAAYHLVPYREPGDLVVFAYNSRDPRVVHAAEAASLTGFRVYLIAPKLHDAYEEKISSLSVERITVEGPAPLLSMSVFSLLIMPNLKGFRAQRVREEIESLDTAFEWVLKEYGEAAVKMPPRPDYIVATPSTYPGASYHCRMIGCTSVIGLESALEYPARTLKDSIAYISSVEQRGFRDVLTKLKTIGTSIIEYNTDPLTTSIYVIITAVIAAKKLL
ncbi:MAG: hypothetical protein F7C07_05465 [Desulfurococcales archaeon]|nr:hypothetical protein [Desulfurococcales archaeon]